MMLTAAIGISSIAPRQNRLKKPRPLRSLSMQEGSVDPDGVPASVVKDRKLSLGSLEVDVSAVYAGSQGSPVCKEIAALSSRLLSSSDEQSGSTQEYTSLSLHNSNSPNCNFEPHCACGHQHHSSPPQTADVSTPAGRHGHPSISTMLPLETTFLHSNLQSQNTNSNSNCESFHMGLDAYGCQLTDEGYSTMCMDSSSSQKGKFQYSTPIAAGTHSSGAKDKDRNQSFQHESSQAATKAVLQTSTGDELMLIGKNIKIIFHASRILLKELDAKLVRIESVHDDDGAYKDGTTSYASAADKCSQADVTNDSCIAGCFPQQKRLDRNWHYSKYELLLLSRCMLSHRPPSMWHVIANTHSDCCIPATKVQKYFEPTAFHCHDGSLVVDRYRN